MLVVAPSFAQADEGRKVGYVLSFRLGVQESEGKVLVDELTRATSEWLGRTAAQGEPVATSCAGDPECVRAAANRLGVTRLGIVTIVAAGGVVRLEVRLMDAKTGSEILRTHAEFEKGQDATRAAKSIFDLMPRLLPGEKAAKRPVDQEPPQNRDPVVAVPPVTEIPPNPEPDPMPDPMLIGTKTSPKASSTRWWLWGGLGAATTALVVTAILVTRDSGGSATVLELPPPQ